MLSLPNGCFPSKTCRTIPSSKSPSDMSWYSASPLRTFRMRFSSRTPVWTRSTSYGSTMVLMYHGIEERVFFLPQGVDPVAEDVPRRTRLRDRVGPKLGRHLDDACPHHDLVDAVGDELPQRHVLPRIGDRHIDDRVEVFAERGDHEGGAADAGTEERAIRRLLVGVLLRAEPCPLQEIEDGHRDAPVAAARPLRRFEVVAALLRMTRE